MGIFTTTKQQQPPFPEQQKSRYERMALLLTMRTSQSPQPAPAALTQSSMGLVASSKAAAQAKSTSTSLNRNMPVASPAVIQRTRFVASSRKLGLGAYGAVLAGTDLCTGEQVAIKIIPDGRMKPANLEREVAVLRRLSDTRHPALCHFHAHIRPEEAKAGEIKVEDSSTTPLTNPLHHYHFLVLEACRGGELFEFVIKKNGLAEAVSAPLFAQLVGAVRTAHSLGIAHRDLKLENVLLCGQEGEPGAMQLKVVDWGLAHQHAISADGLVLPEMLHSRCGSRSYMAPEVTNKQFPQVSGSGYDGFLADTWSLGVCLFAIHLGFFPFEHADAEADWRARRVVEAQGRGESTMRTIFSFYPHKPLEEAFSASLLQLLDRLLVFDPSRRATIAEAAAHPWLACHMHAPPPPWAPLVPTWLPPSLPLARAPGLLEPKTASLTSTGSAALCSVSHSAWRGGTTSSSSTSAISSIAVRLERQDSTCTAHSVGSSVGSSVVHSVARLHALEAAAFTAQAARDTLWLPGPLPGPDDSDASGGMRFAVAGGARRHRSEEHAGLRLGDRPRGHVDPLQARGGTWTHRGGTEEHGDRPRGHVDPLSSPRWNVTPEQRNTLEAFFEKVDLTACTMISL